MSRCVHLTPSDEAYEVNDDGSLTPTEVLPCEWGDANPDRLLNMPRWLSEWALSGGPSFDPKKHCPGCPGYRSQTP